MTALSKISVKHQTVIPAEVRDLLGLKPGDQLRYQITQNGVIIDKAPDAAADDPFDSFTEWAGAEDDEAYAGL